MVDGDRHRRSLGTPRRTRNRRSARKRVRETRSQATPYRSPFLNGLSALLFHCVEAGGCCSRRCLTREAVKTAHTPMTKSSHGTYGHHKVCLLDLLQVSDSMTPVRRGERMVAMWRCCEGPP